MSEESPTFVFVNGDDPGEITVTLYRGSGVDQVSLEKKLTVRDMERLHLKLTAALWWRSMVIKSPQPPGTS